MLVAKIYVSRTDIKAEKVTPVTAGMVGAEVDVYFGREWDGYAKTYVWEHGGVTKDDTTCSGTIPPEVVARSGGSLKFGVFGTKDGKATPTLWCTVDVVKPGADPSGDETTDPTLPVWAQLREEIEKLKQESGGTITDEQIAAALEKYLAENPIEGISEEEVRQIIADYLAENPVQDGKPGEDGGYYTPAVTQPTDDTMQVAFTPSKAGMPAVQPATVKLPVGSGSGSSPNVNLTVETITVDDNGEPENVPVSGLSLDLTTYSAKVGDGFYINPVVIPSNATNRAVTWKSSATNIATVDNSGYVECIAEGSAVITCTTVDGSFTATCAVSVAAESSGETEVTLSSISVTYNGGDVAVGTAVNDLTGIVVKAHYSDGTSQTVTGYTLSGTIVEGSNTVTVSYGGKTASFTVTGVAESTGDAKVQLSTLERTEGLMGPAGTVIELGGCYHVTVPYSDGMFISTGVNSAWGRDQYPAVVVLDNGTYALPTMTFAESHAGSLGGKYPTQCTCTLNGYTESATVYVSMLVGTATDDAIDGKDIFYYIPGGEN